MKFDPRALLKYAGCYRVLTWIGSRGRTKYVRDFIRPLPGDRVLDIGCGPGDMVAYLPNDVAYVGFDASEEYIASAQAKFPGRGTFRCELVTEASLPDPGTYDIVNATGVLHHLADDEALSLFRLAKAALKPTGRLVTLDNCYIPGQNWLAKRLIRMDRGEFIRVPDEYVRLAREVFPELSASIRHDLLSPIPYTHVILVAQASAQKVAKVA